MKIGSGAGRVGMRGEASALIAALLAVILVWVGLSVTNRLPGFGGRMAILAIGLMIAAVAAAIMAKRIIRHLRRLERGGMSDSLTSLPNRLALHRDIRRAQDDGQEIALALLGLDGFRFASDQYGHVVADTAIKECAAILTGLADGEAQVYRLVGDDYALMVSGETASARLETLCRKVLERLRQPVEVGDRRLAFGANIGLARLTAREALISSELLRRADVALLASKGGGGTGCTWFNPAFDRSREHLRHLGNELRAALDSGEFHLVYQPLVDSSTRQVIAVEALLRWKRPDGQEVGPATFIPVAEESGLINPIGLWVLRQACRDAMAWDGIDLSVNISAAQLRNPEFPLHLGLILEETDFDPERLELEIAETCLVLEPGVAERSLGIIRSFGVRVALDDFGTGPTSMGFLRQFRLEKLKLDRSLVAQAVEDVGSRAVMLSSITVARALKMDVAAAGVETEAQADIVRAAGCDQIQGWHYFKALPASEIPQHLGRPVGVVIRNV